MDRLSPAPSLLPAPGLPRPSARPLRLLDGAWVTSPRARYALPALSVLLLAAGTFLLVDTPVMLEDLRSVRGQVAACEVASDVQRGDHLSLRLAGDAAAYSLPVSERKAESICGRLLTIPGKTVRIAVEATGALSLLGLVARPGHRIWAMGDFAGNIVSYQEAFESQVRSDQRGGLAVFGLGTLAGFLGALGWRRHRAAS